MGFGALRSIVRPLTRIITSRTYTCSATPFPSAFTSFKSELVSNVLGGTSLRSGSKLHQWFGLCSNFHSLTDTRFPKRRPSDKSRRKRASLKPPGPYAWVRYVPGEPILPNNPNDGGVKRRNEKKRMKQRRAFILAEKKKRKTLLQEANRKKMIKRVERKMAAVARERAWAEKLAEMQRLEEEKKRSMS